MKHVEKVVALVLLLVLASSCVSSAVQAFTTVAKTKVCVHPEDFKVGVGEVFEVYINVCDVSGLQGFDFMLKYDTDVLDCVALEEGTFLSSFGDTFVAMQEINDEFTPEHGRVWLAVAILGKGYADGSGILAVIRFNATAVGESVLDLYSDYPYRPDEVKLTTCGSEAISNAAMDGHVVVDCCSNDPDPPDDPVDSGVPVAKFKYSPLDPEVYDAVTFDASLSYDPDGFIFSYTWNFGDGNTTTLRSSIITHHFSTRGSYNVNLTVKDNLGLTNSTVEPIQVRGRAPPVAAFTWTPMKPQAGEPVMFDASNSTANGGEIVLYAWDFGDGVIQVELEPHVTHVFQAFGNYMVVLNVTDSEGESGVTMNMIWVMESPVADFFFEPIEPRVCTIVTFNASISIPRGGCIIDYEWNFGGGSPVEFGMVVTHRFLNMGEFDVSLKVTDSEGKWDMKTIKLKVLPHIADLNEDGTVNIFDLAICARSYGSFPGHERWNAKADVDGNGKVNILDVVVIARSYNKECIDPIDP